ncbi:YncE family protein [Streptomyces anulatus]|uniref:YncE family protein n=1 Tax=Streptomyces anulatus TaxID=1892 RepID=UPI003F49F60E
MALPVPARSAEQAGVGLVAAAPNPRAYVLDGNLSAVVAYDTVTGERVAQINVPSGSTRIVPSPDGSLLYALKSFSPNSIVTVLSTTTNDTVAAISVGSGSRTAAVSPDGSRLYAVNRSGQSVSVVDTATNTVTATVPVGGAEPQEAAVSPDGGQVYVAHTGGVTVIDAATLSTSLIPIAGMPRDVAFSPTAAAPTSPMKSSLTIRACPSSTPPPAPSPAPSRSAGAASTSLSALTESAPTSPATLTARSP